MSEPLPLPVHGESDRRTFPDLRNLLDGWFHQDFDLEGPNLETILPKFVSVSWRASVEGAINDIGRFVSLYGEDDSTLHDAVERILAPGIIIEGWEGLTTREWLLRVAELLEAGLALKDRASP